MTPTEPWMRAAGRAFVSSIASAVRPDARIWVDQWAEDNRILPPDTPEPGPFRNTRTPYLIDIQRTMSPSSPYREGWWMKPHQVGGSVTGENLIGSWICTAAGSILVVFPTLDDAKQWELTRFEPMRANTKALRRRIRSSDKKGADNTKLRKRFAGGVMRLVGANRVGALKSSTIRYVKFEEPDEYQLLDQGSVVELAKARTANFGRKAKIYGDGTPTFDGRSEIQRQVLRGDQRKWHLHCPDCAHAQPLVWEQLKWVDGEPDTAKYACTECGSLNDEAAWKARNYAPRQRHMTELDAAAAGLAHWLPTATGQPGVASWCGFEALAAPIGWRPWPGLVVDWLSAQGNSEDLRIFFNNLRGLPYQDKVRTEVGAEQLQQRAERYDLMSCPHGGLVAVAGVDTQDNRLAVVIRAFGRGEESWGVWHGEIYGDTSSPEVWGKLRELLDAPIRHACGQIMRIDAAAIDSGGHHTEDVYAFCRDAQMRGRHWFAIKGAKSYDAPKLGRPKTIDFTWRGQAVPGGVTLRHVGTQSIKSLIDGRLKLTKAGGGCYHFPLGFQADYYKQLRAERREWRRDMQGHKALWWVHSTNERNEAWDCEVYAYVAYLYSMSGRHAETVFKAREKLFGTVHQTELQLATGDAAPPHVEGIPIPAQVQAPELTTSSAPHADTELVAPASPAQSPVPVWPAAASAAPARTKPAPKRPTRGGFVNSWRP